ncbi:MAG TPA: hypothetical protein VK202_02920 [Bacteroidia bacterium]|nr:hypothetical protein [Bacteroidia bacterium]
MIQPLKAGLFSSKGFLAAAYLLLWALLVFVHHQLFPYIDDDSYIHLRIVRNLLEQGVPYFNTEEQIMSSSSSGWTMFLFLFFKVFGYKLTLLPWLHATALTLDVFVYQLLIQQLTDLNRFLSFTSSSVLVISACQFASLGYMETTFTLALLGFGAWLYYRGNAWAFLFLAAAPFFRMEIWAAFILFAAGAVVFKQVKLLPSLGFSALGALPFFTYNMHFFGTNVPNTIGAKSVIYDLTAYNTLMKEWFSFVQGNAAGKFISIFLVLVFLVLVLITVLRKFTEANNYLLMAFGVGIAVAYVFKKILMFHWYIPIYTLPVILGCFIWIVRERRVAFSAVLLLLLLPYMFLFAQAVYASATGRFHAYKNFKPGARVQQYLQVSQWLYKKYPNATLMTSEIGGLGYGFEGKILDGCGLISPEAIKYHPMKVPEQRTSSHIGAIPLKYVQEKMPELVVSLESFCEEFSRSNLAQEKYYKIQLPVFTARDLRLSPDSTIWGSNFLLVYVRKDIATYNR